MMAVPFIGFLPSGRKTYDAYEAQKAYEEYFKNRKR